jgi:hypothetical protein
MEHGVEVVVVMTVVTRGGAGVRSDVLCAPSMCMGIKVVKVPCM